MYGHPSHESSRYTLLVYQVIDVNGNFFDYQNSDSDHFQRSRNPKVSIKDCQLPYKTIIYFSNFFHLERKNIFYTDSLVVSD